VIEISFLLIDFRLLGSLIVPLKHSAVGMPILQTALYSLIRDSSGGVVTRLWAGSPSNRDSVLGRDKSFILQSPQAGPGVHVILFNVWLAFP
jgi:hypothetical protein